MDKFADVELVTAAGDIAALISEHDSLAVAASVLGVDALELDEAAATAFDLLVAPVLSRADEDAPAIAGQAELMWALAYLAGWRLRRQLDYPPPLDPLPLGVIIYASQPPSSRLARFGGLPLLGTLPSSLLELGAIRASGAPLDSAMGLLLKNALACALR